MATHSYIRKFNPGLKLDICTDHHIPVLKQHNNIKKIVGVYQEKFNGTKILDHLFLGSAKDAKMVTELKKHNITHILNLAGEELNTNPHTDDIQYKQLNIADSHDEQISDYFKECNDYIQKVIDQGGTVLVHCQMGLSRSPTIVMAYLIDRCNYTYQDALFYIQLCRDIEPNINFIAILEEYSNKTEK